MFLGLPDNHKILGKKVIVYLCELLLVFDQTFSVSGIHPQKYFVKWWGGHGYGSMIAISVLKTGSLRVYLQHILSHGFYQDIIINYQKISKIDIKVAQINYVSRSQLHCAANLNFGLMCKKAKHCIAGLCQLDSV